MKIQLQDQPYKFLTENSTECDEQCAFVQTALNEKYLEDAKSRGAHSILKPAQLRELFGLDRIEIVGITGTNGKTTTASAIYSMLLDLGYRVAFQGTRGFYVNDKMVETKSLTTPTLLHTYRHIYQAVASSCDFFIMEVSSHAIDQNRIEAIDFKLKILTNITQDHLDYHKTIDEYRRVKNSFFSDSGLKLINKDEKYAEFNIKNTYTYAIEEPASYRVGAYSLNSGIDAAIEHFEKRATFSSPLHGFFNIYNLLCAVASVHMLTERKLDDVCEVVDGFAGVSGRMEVVSEDPLVIVDFAHTPDGMAQALGALKEREVVVVFGAGGDRDRTKRAKMGSVAASLATKVYITSDNPRFEDPDQIIADILDGITDRDRVYVEVDRRKAIEMAICNRVDNEIVLILGKGDEEYQIVYDKEFEFDDRIVAKELLRGIES